MAKYDLIQKCSTFEEKFYVFRVYSFTVQRKIIVDEYDYYFIITFFAFFKQLF